MKNHRYLVVLVMASMIGFITWLFSSGQILGNSATSTPTPVQSCPTEMLPTQYYSSQYRVKCAACWPSPTSNVTTFPTPTPFATRDRTATAYAQTTLTPGQTEMPTQTVTSTPTPTATTAPANGFYIGGTVLEVIGTYPAWSYIPTYPGWNTPVCNGEVAGWDMRTGSTSGFGYLYFRDLDQYSHATISTFGDVGHRLFTTQYYTSLGILSWYTSETGGALHTATSEETSWANIWSLGASWESGGGTAYVDLTIKPVCYGIQATATPTPTVQPCTVLKPVKEVMAKWADDGWWKLGVEGESEGVYEMTTGYRDTELEFKVEREMVNSIIIEGDLSGGWYLDIYDDNNTSIYHYDLPDTYEDLEVNPLWEKVSSIRLVHDVSVYGDAGYINSDVVLTDGCEYSGIDGVIMCDNPSEFIVDPNPPPLVGLGSVAISQSVCNNIIEAGEIPTQWLKDLLTFLNSSWKDLVPSNVNSPGMRWCVRWIKLPIITLAGITIPVDAIIGVIVFFLAFKAVTGRFVGG